jgi:deazaflavin-dependent oxidoreductase (nitroreductase family)
MVKKIELTILQTIFQKSNNLIMTLLVPLEKPGGVFKWVFKIPILFDTVGLNVLIPNWILLLTSTGRRTGKRIVTPVEFIDHQADGSFWVISGWRGNTDWYKNIRKCPEVQVKVHGKTCHANAVILTNEEILVYLIEILKVNPDAIAIFSRWAGKPIDPSEEVLRQVCSDFPGYSLKPDQPPKWF